MSKQKYVYKVMVERVTKVPYLVEARNEREAVHIIKRSAKEDVGLPESVTVGTVASYGKLIRPGTWEVTQQEVAEVTE